MHSIANSTAKKIRLTTKLCVSTFRVKKTPQKQKPTPESFFKSIKKVKSIQFEHYPKFFLLNFRNNLISPMAALVIYDNHQFLLKHTDLGKDSSA